MTAPKEPSGSLGGFQIIAVEGAWLSLNGPAQRVCAAEEDPLPGTDRGEHAQEREKAKPELARPTPSASCPSARLRRHGGRPELDKGLITDADYFTPPGREDSGEPPNVFLTDTDACCNIVLK